MAETNTREKRKLPRQQTLVVRFEPSILDLVKGLFRRNSLKQKFERSITAIESDDMDERMFDRTRSPFDLDVHIAPKLNSTDFRTIRCWFDTCCFQGNIISKQFVDDLGFEEADYEPLTPREELGGQTMNGTIHPVEAAILLTWHHNTGPRYRNMRFLISSTLDSHTMIIGTRSIVKHDLLSPPVFMNRETRPKQVFRPILNDEDLGKLKHALRVLERDIKNIDADIKGETDKDRLAQHQEARKGQEHQRDLQKYRIDIYEANMKGNLDESKRLQVSTNGYDICDPEGYTCLSNVLPLTTQSILFRRQDAGTINLFKRSSTRDPFTVKPPGRYLVLKSKSYYTSGELFEKAKTGGSKIKEAWIDFAFDAVDNYKVSLFGQKPPQPKKPLPEHDYITEHIVEITCSKNPDSVNIKIKQQVLGKVDPAWFTRWWNTDVQAPVDSRPHPFPGYKNSNIANSKDESLNDLVFEAMGSIRNVDHFLLCENAINSFRAKLWSNESPIDQDVWSRQANFAASGELPTNEHLGGIRTTLAVYEYMHLPEMMKRMRNTVKNVQTGFSNVQHLTSNNLPMIGGTTPVDLSEAWLAFISQQLGRSVAKGSGWLRDSISFGTTQYNSALTGLKKAQEAIDNESKERNPVKKRKLENTRVTARNKAVDVAVKKCKRRSVLEKELQDKMKAVEDAETIVNTISDPVQKDGAAETQDVEGKRRRMGPAKNELTVAKKQVEKADRTIKKLDSALLPAELAAVREAIRILKAFDTARTAMKPLEVA
ncbi:hypothetical protein E8E11_005933 [Didymella keratinophila]|nr:hypothetical protein E8E11_005933 [Didymella keratinophila]